MLEIERLGAAYGIDADRLWDEPIVLAHGDGIAVLTSLEEYANVSDLVRARMIQAASAAKDLVTLRRLLGEVGPPLPSLRAIDPQAPPFEQGADLAASLRSALGLGAGPIPSMRDLVATRLPGIGVLHANLGTSGAAGLAFADAVRGPAIVLNAEGKNGNAAVRRFSLAHELCHLLIDWNRAEPLAMVSGFLSDQALEREQRANAFAVRLLCPQSFVEGLRNRREEDAAQILIEEYGMHYRAARLYLANRAGMRLPLEPPAELDPFLTPPPSLEAAEAPRGLHAFPVARTPLERRGTLARTAARAYGAGKIPRDAFARFLGVTAGEPLEAVLGYFDLDLPEDVAHAASA